MSPLKLTHSVPCLVTKNTSYRSKREVRAVIDRILSLKNHKMKAVKMLVIVKIIYLMNTK